MRPVIRQSHGPRAAAAAALLVYAHLAGGCLVYDVASVPVKVAVTTADVAADVTGAAVKATGKVAVSSFDAVGRVGSTSIESSARLTQAGMVTFVDASTGTVVRVPWRRGMSLATASADARFQLGGQAFQLIRAGTVYRPAAALAGSLAAASGDVIRLGS